MSKINLALIFGGKSNEHSVSRLSAVAIIKNIPKEKYNLYLIGINKTGEWFFYDGNIEDISDGSWENHQNKKVIISPDPATHGIIIFNDNAFTSIKIDVVIPVLHGKNGEDGTIQGLLQLSGIPFVGCQTCSSATCMDKAITCTMLESNGIQKPKFIWFLYNQYEQNKDKIINNAESIIGNYPMFVKPANSGSSVGISKAHNRNELISAIDIAKEEDQKIIIEQFIDGHEVECAVIGNENPIASIIGEIVTESVFYDYDAKYINDTSKLYIPAKIPDNISESVRKIAIESYKIMGCSGLSRIDFLIERKTNNIFLNEINTFPGFTSISMYPKLMEKMGISFENLIDKLINLAIEKQKYL